MSFKQVTFFVESDMVPRIGEGSSLGRTMLEQLTSPDYIPSLSRSRTELLRNYNKTDGKVCVVLV